jgi:hypothetical protein
MKCLEEFLKKTVDDLVAQGVDIDAMSGKKKAPQPDPERDDIFQSMEQEFPFLYPNDFVVTKEAMPAWAPAAQPEEDVGMTTRQCSDDVMMPWTSSTHMMY